MYAEFGSKRCFNQAKKVRSMYMFIFQEKVVLIPYFSGVVLSGFSFPFLFFIGWIPGYAIALELAPPPPHTHILRVYRVFYKIDSQFALLFERVIRLTQYGE